MKREWQTEANRIEIRWTGLQMEDGSDRSWLNEFSDCRDSIPTPLVPDLCAHSPLGSGEWMVPWDARWTRPDKM